MKSILEIFKQGMGPSSVLNMVPYQACMDVANEIHLKREKISHVEVVLYNEYARLEKESNISLDIEFAFAYSNFKYVITKDKPTPAAVKKEPYVFDIIVYTAPDQPAYRHRVISKHGSYSFSEAKKQDALPFNTFEEVKKWFKDNPGKSYLDFASQGADREEIKAMYYRGVNLAEIATLQGLRKHGELRLNDPNIHYTRQARNIWLHDENLLSQAENANRIISAYAYAMSEEIVEKRVMISAPTLCTTSVVWAMIAYLNTEYDVPARKMIDAVCAASIFAGLVDKNASYASIDVGCQGPMGTACGMAAVIAAVVMYDAKIEECGRAFEMALEHSLGIICDAMSSLPIVPCIKRCSAFATRAYEIAVLNHSLMTTPEVCKLDDVIKVIGETGGDLIMKNRRLGMGGFADHAKYCLEAATERDWK